MANTIENTLNKIGNVIEDIFNGETTDNSKGYVTSSKTQSCLEKIRIRMREQTLSRNEWKKNLQYTKPLTDAEYLIQQEFKIN
jgi:hypothetical protein